MGERLDGGWKQDKLRLDIAWAVAFLPGSTGGHGG
jgi:hypothetical protein